ncbi:transposase [Malacoplasma penetrans HF-2]|uniref:Transposase n=1 Tax=Malacoplasma penetrans (strain HF-2) TaxID=272633 RepID=Q8EX43_MALP2|nr:transposase [Malacoplasma penetrans HF-2]
MYLYNFLKVNNYFIYLSHVIYLRNKDLVIFLKKRNDLNIVMKTFCNNDFSKYEIAYSDHKA